MPARPFSFTLSGSEQAALREPAGAGGHQALQALLIERLQEGNGTLELDDAELGKVIRYMTQYQGGGFQNRLRAGFIRSLRELLDL